MSRLRALRMPGHGRDEVFSLDGEQVELSESGDGRRAWDVAEQGDLAEIVAGLQPLTALSVEAHLCFAVHDHIEGISRLALADDRLSRLDLKELRLSSQLLDERRRQRPEDRDRV